MKITIEKRVTVGEKEILRTAIIESEKDVDALHAAQQLLRQIERPADEKE